MAKIEYQIIMESGEIRWQQYSDTLFFEIEQTPMHSSVEYFEFPFEIILPAA